MDDSSILTVQQLEELIFQTPKGTNRRWGSESSCITGRLQKEDGKAEKNWKKRQETRCEKELTKPRKGGCVCGEQSITTTPWLGRQLEQARGESREQQSRDKGTGKRQQIAGSDLQVVAVSSESG